jgi:hypothetical protein
MMYSSVDSSNIMKKKGLCAAQGVVYNIIAGRHARSNTGKDIIGSYAKMSSRYVNNVVSTSTFNTLDIKPVAISNSDLKFLSHVLARDFLKNGRHIDTIKEEFLKANANSETDPHLFVVFDYTDVPL